MIGVLRHEPSDLIGGRWAPLSGDAMTSVNPARPREVLWRGSPRVEHVDQAVAAAREAQGEWVRWPREKRFGALRHYAELCRSRQAEVATLIADETGKVMWDAAGEAAALAAKVEITLDEAEHGGLRRVSGFEIPLADTRVGRTWFRAHGVMAVIAPYNFPAHLANGHIVPALAMGNTVVLKPSDKTPAVGQLLAELLEDALIHAGAPTGTVNLVQGGAEVATRLTTHADIDGILFTGSWPVGRKILEANLDVPGRIVALEMGGNNAAVAMPDCDLRQAVIECVRSAFVTTGQRCTCTRRIVVHRGVADRFIPALCKVASNLILGDPRAEHPVFMGPIISDAARQGVLDAQAALAKAGGEVLVESTRVDMTGGGYYISPGVMRVDRFTAASEEGAGCDREVFGPLVRVSVTDSLDDAIAQANASCFGLAASIFTRERAAAERFCEQARAGCVNVNAGTAGASSKLPFGGLGRSGNHRPAGSFSLDYCAYPVAGMIETGDAAPVPQGMRIHDDWL
jgi:succinylglutamic semialdehyde dehydrogenase